RSSRSRFAAATSPPPTSCSDSPARLRATSSSRSRRATASWSSGSRGRRSPPCPSRAPASCGSLPLVDRGVDRQPREDGVRAALPPQHLRPEIVGARLEDIVAERGLEVPGLLVQLRLELPACPPRVAGEPAQ